MGVGESLYFPLSFPVNLKCSKICSLFLFLKNRMFCPGWGGSVGWNIFPWQKSCRSDSCSGHIPRLRVQSLIQAHTIPSLAVYGRQLIRASHLHWCFLLSLPLSFPLSLKSNGKMSSAEDFFFKLLFKDLCQMKLRQDFLCVQASA